MRPETECPPARLTLPRWTSCCKAGPAAGNLALFGREAVKEELRRAMAGGETRAEAIWETAAASLARRFAPTLVRAINATGVLLHTNLGRAPLPAPARAAILEAAAGYATVEYDPARGARGKRQDHVRALARDLFACGDAIAVNNNAAAVLLALAALARGPQRARLARRARRDRRLLQDPRDPRGLGGAPARGRDDQPHDGRGLPAGLRSGGRAAPLGPSLQLRDPRLHARGRRRASSRSLAREAGVPWLHDQGTGAVVPLDEFGVPDEPTVAECLAAGADLVAFSGGQALLGAAGRLPRRQRRARRASRRASGGARGPARQADARGPRRDARGRGRREPGAQFPVYRAAGARARGARAAGRADPRVARAGGLDRQGPARRRPPSAAARARRSSSRRARSC